MLHIIGASITSFPSNEMRTNGKQQRNIEKVREKLILKNPTMAKCDNYVGCGNCEGWQARIKHPDIIVV